MLHEHLLAPLCSACGSYAERPAIATERLSLVRDGRVVYGLLRHWRDGTSAVPFDTLTFVERFAALVPRPKTHQHTYHDALAPAASISTGSSPGHACTRE